jgi:hemerythrin
MAVLWTQDYAVGVDLIDRQHQELFRRFNALIEACKERKGREQVAGLLDFLSGYVISHFQEEEALMADHQYPGAAEHSSQHRDFAGQLRELRSHLDVEGASFNLLIETNESVLRWLIQHIRRTDTAFGAFLQTRR